jgi:hypothetical protein
VDRVLLTLSAEAVRMEPFVRDDEQASDAPAESGDPGNQETPSRAALTFNMCTDQVLVANPGREIDGNCHKEMTYDHHN